MPTIIVPADVAARLAAPLGASANLEVIVAPEDATVLTPDELSRLNGAFFNIASGPAASRKVLGSALRAPNLTWLHLGHSGTDDPAFQTFLERGITLTNSAGVNAEPIAQSVMAGLLALNRQLPHWLEAQRRGVWEPSPRGVPLDELPPMLRGQTMVIFGLGSIGQYVAQFARAFGIHVIGVRRRPASLEDGVDDWVPPERLSEVLPRANILVLTAPLVNATRGLIDAAALDLLPAGAILINVSRGEITDEAAVADRLASGRLSGAYLDVFGQEPLPSESPFWGLSNVIISPHDSALSAATQPRVDAIFLEELARWMRGEESPRRVLER